MEHVRAFINVFLSQMQILVHIVAIFLGTMCHVWGMGNILKLFIKTQKKFYCPTPQIPDSQNNGLPLVFRM